MPFDKGRRGKAQLLLRERVSSLYLIIIGLIAIGSRRIFVNLIVIIEAAVRLILLFIFAAVLLRRLRLHAVEVDQKFFRMVHLFFYFWTHQGVLQHNFQFLERMHYPNNIRLLIDLVFSLLKQLLVFLLFAPAAFRHHLSEIQLYVITVRNSNYMMLSHLVLYSYTM